MFRLSKPEPYKKTPLFPKRPDVAPQKVEDEEDQPEKVNKEDEEKDEVKDDVERIPVIFRSFKKSDLLQVGYRFETQLLSDMSGRTKPEISEIFPDITKEMERYGEWNAELYSAKTNIIVYVLENPLGSYDGLYPILMKYNQQGSGQYQGYPYVSLPIIMKNLHENHKYLARLGSHLPWESYSIQLEGLDGGAAISWSDDGMKCTINIPIEYVSFSETLDYMYVYIAGIRKEWRSLKTDDTYREK